MYKSMKILIGKHFYKTADAAQNKLDVFFAVNRLSQEEYEELTALVETVYGGEPPLLCTEVNSNGMQEKGRREEKVGVRL